VAAQSAIFRTMLTEWFKTNQELEVARSLTFDQFPQQWVWNRKLKRWTMCRRGFAIGHMYYAHPTSGEHYYLQMLLKCVKGVTSYEHLRTVDGTEHDTFKDACIAMVCLQTIMNGIKPWKKPVFGPQDDNCVTCLPPC
jgi:hypothetical protein